MAAVHRSALSCPASRAYSFLQPKVFIYLPFGETLPRPTALSYEVPPFIGHSAVPCLAWQHLCHLAPRLIVVLWLFLVTHPFVLVSGRLWLRQVLCP